MASSQPQPVDLFTTLILLLEEHSQYWEHAADSCENFVERLPQQDREKMALNCVVYRERAALLRRSASDIKNQLGGHEYKPPA